MSISDELEKLDELRQRGVLSFREFQALKAKLLHLVDDANTLDQLNEINPGDDVPESGIAADSVDPPSTDASVEAPPFDAENLDEQLDPDDKSLSQLDSVSMVAEVPELIINTNGSSPFEKIEIPDEVLQVDPELDLDTENLNQLEKNELLNKVAQLDSQLKNIQVQNEVAQVDRAWERERKRYEVVGEHGHRRMPSKGGSVVVGVAASIFGLFWITLSLGVASRISILPFLGVAVVIVGVAISFHSYKKAEEYERARRRYHQRRSKANRKR